MTGSGLSLNRCHCAMPWIELFLWVEIPMSARWPSQPVAQKSYDFRTLGLGYANLGTLLMVQGIPYDSAPARAIAGALTAIMHCGSYAASAEMAGELGPFARYEANKDAMLRVIRNHRRAAYAGDQNAPKGQRASDYESLSTLPVPIDPAECPADLTTRSPSSPLRMSSARSSALPNVSKSFHCSIRRLPVLTDQR